MVGKLPPNVRTSAMHRLLPVVLLLPLAAPALTAEPTAAERGRTALTTTAFIPGFWSPRAVNEAWRQWGVAEKPADYAAAFRDRYGLHPAPYPNDGLPMGLRKSRTLFASSVAA